jgi:hypothetical protein
MQLFGTSVIEHEEKTAPAVRAQTGGGLRAAAVLMLGLATGLPSGFAQQSTVPADKAASALPAAPVPTPTEPLDLRSSARDFSKPAGTLRGNPINMYRPTTIGKASFANSVRLTDLVKDGKIYLSLSDAIALTLENNYDIAIARYDLDIADTDILRTRTGASPLGAPSGLISGTLGGSASTLATGGGPGGTSVGSGGAGSGSSGLVLTTQGTGPAPEALEPSVGGKIQLERAESPLTGPFSPRSFTNTDQYNFTYNQGFVTGTALDVAFNNSRVTTTNFLQSYSPELNTNFRATVTQHLLQGAGIWVNKRFIPAADSVHGQPSREYLLGTGAGLSGCAIQRAGAGPEHEAGWRRSQAVGDRHSGASASGAGRLDRL